MPLVVTKAEAQQSRSARYRTRDLFVCQRTQPINALRGHFLEFGIALPNGEMRRMQSMPGIGPIIALAVEAFGPSMDDFERGRDLRPGWVLRRVKTRLAEN